ncbi:putative RNA polymerase II subunit B1 CTD phosphatase rpap2 [Notolabrus celidotus]|uniref:putative RNA polymerase II subunit B1 CTD phosphatase rpap2 n=1 Tax=Notolabrus celidotus TaxID=1203425 RepID=UPI00148F7306|nr:putative RNA polymerase II subunit B1 CTD phosphatase rpap2 [Notolabrus celidotus]
METEQRRRSDGSAKTQKKGGKRSKALSAEEEARRREVVKETLREKFELEKRALKVVDRLLEDRVAENVLIDCARLIAPANYKDAVEERSIAKLCGYPICSNKLGKIPTQQFKISTKTNKVYDITERKCFCSNFCYKASKQFELQISKTPLWLRLHESPSEIKLMKKGDGGSSGEEVMLMEKRLQEGDIENPLAAEPKGPCASQQHPDAASLNHSDGSDIEQEQDFVSSVLPQRQGPRVHWGDTPKRTDADGEEEEKERRRKTERQKKQGREENKEQIDRHDAKKEGGMRNAESGKKSHPSETEVDLEKSKQLLSSNIDITNVEQVTEDSLQEEFKVEEATKKLDVCSLSETVPHTAPLSVHSLATQAENSQLIDSAESKESEDLSTESKHSPSLTPDSQNTALTDQPGLNITQVGMSKRGAAGLRDLLKNHTAGAEPASIRLNLLECLRRTLKDWSTDETLEFLYGADHSLSAPFADDKEDDEEKEELDEDDLDDVVTNEDAGEVQQRPCAAAPDYETLRKESEQLGLRVKEFYKGTWILPEEGKEPDDKKVTAQDLNRKDPALPLVDSQAQNLIQKRIAVEKLNSCLKNIVGPLRLTMSDVSADLNNLIRTFRFTNTNIIHKSPEWTLIAVVLLHLLSEVSPLVREALEMPASTVYLNTLLEELGLQQQDLLNLVQMFKIPAH